MLQHGFVRVAAVLPRLRVADCVSTSSASPSAGSGRTARPSRSLSFPSWRSPATPAAICFISRRCKNPPSNRLTICSTKAKRVSPACSWSACRGWCGDQLYNVAAVCQRGSCWASCPSRTCRTIRNFTKPAGSRRRPRNRCLTSIGRAIGTRRSGPICFSPIDLFPASSSASKFARTCGRRLRRVAFRPWPARRFSSISPQATR